LTREVLKVRGAVALQALCGRPAAAAREERLAAQQLAFISQQARELQRAKRILLFGNYHDLDRSSRTELLKSIEPGEPRAARRLESLIDVLRSRVVGPRTLSEYQHSRELERASQARTVIEEAERLRDAIGSYQHRWGGGGALETPQTTDCSH